MDVQLRTVTAIDEALELAPALERSAAEVLAEFRDHPLPERCVQRFFERHFGGEETALIVAERDGTVIGSCLVGPFEDPLTAERIPTVLLLGVERTERHRGVAGRLVDAADRVLRERGFGELGARAGHNDDALISMGERWGFVRLWEFMVRD